MKIVGPERFQLTYNPESFTVICPLGSSKFSGIAKSLMPKLYIVSVDEKPIYVGITKRGMQQRLTYGWKATGASGYYGYAWRHHGAAAMLDIWEHADAVGRNEREIETVEAEVVYLIRQAGQWPAFQTEIHFYQSNEEHRQIAAEIVSRYCLTSPKPQEPT